MTEPATPEGAAPSQPDQQQQKFNLNYETMTAVFADHVVLSSTNGGLIFDFASCAVSDPGSGEATVPIHRRVAMTNDGAAQLFQLLSGVFTTQPPGSADGPAAAADPATAPAPAPE